MEQAVPKGGTSLKMASAVFFEVFFTLDFNLNREMKKM
jgi:hypothetical protein